MRAERACRVCTAPLPLVLIDIDPAVLKAFLYRCNVVLTKRCERLKHRLLRLIIGNLFGCIRDHRRVDVIHVKFVHPEALLAQLYIAVHLVHVGIYGLHQIAVNLRRHIVRIDCRFQRRRIISRLRIENLLLYLSVVKSGNRSGKLFVDAVKSFKRIFF